MASAAPDTKNTDNTTDATPVSTVKTDTTSTVDTNVSPMLAKYDNTQLVLSTKYNLENYDVAILNRIDAIVEAGGFNATVILNTIDYINVLDTNKAVDSTVGAFQQNRFAENMANMFNVASDGYQNAVYLILDRIAANRNKNGAFSDAMFHRYDTIAYKNQTIGNQAIMFTGLLVALSDPSTRVAAMKQFSNGMAQAGEYLKTMYGVNGECVAYNRFITMFKR